MKIIKLILEKTIFLSKVTSSTSDALHTLVEFLISEAHSVGYCNLYKSWLKKNRDFILGNAYELNTRGDTKILVNEQEFLSGKSEPDENDPFVFVTTKKQLIIILNQWMNIISCQPKPHEIDIIQEDDGSITFTAFDSQGNEIEIEQNKTVKEKIFAFFSKLKKKIFK